MSTPNSAPYLRLAQAPTFQWNAPNCGACYRDLTNDWDGWVCPKCGTHWPIDAQEDTRGTLYEDWAGETLPGPTIPNEEAFLR